MKKVKYVPIGNELYKRLTVGKVYDVISFDTGSVPQYANVTIINDWGASETFFMYHRTIDIDRFSNYINYLQFIDVTIEHRDQVIIELLS